MRDVLGSSAPSPWDILRGLVEAEWLIETSNVSWRARRWWLREPTVAKLALTDGTFALLLRGSTPTAVRRRFTDTVTASGCTLHVRHGVGSYSPLSMLATGGQLDSVEKELNWPVATAGSVSVAVALCAGLASRSMSLATAWPENGGGSVELSSRVSCQQTTMWFLSVIRANVGIERTCLWYPNG